MRTAPPRAQRSALDLHVRAVGGPGNVGDWLLTAVLIEEFGSQEVAEGLWQAVAAFRVH